MSDAVDPLGLRPWPDVWTVWECPDRHRVICPPGTPPWGVPMLCPDDGQAMGWVGKSATPTQCIPTGRAVTHE